MNCKVKNKFNFKVFLMIMCMSMVLSLKSRVYAEEGQKSHGKSHTLVNQNGIEISVEKGFHFNVKAPASLTLLGGKTGDGVDVIQPKIKVEKQFVFEYSQSAKNILTHESREAKLSFYVCDDPNTVCEEHIENVTLPKFVDKTKSSTTKSSTMMGEPSEAKDQKITSPKSSEKVLEKVNEVGLSVDKNGFVKDKFEEALHGVAEKKQWLFIDFRASWCPPCIRLEHEVFPARQFQKLRSKIGLLQIDVDDARNNTIVSKYKVKAYPTLLVVDEAGQERARFLDYMPAQELVGRLEALLKARPEALENLIADAEKGNLEAIKKLAEHFHSSLQYEKALEYFTRAKSFGFKYHEAEIAYRTQNADEAEGSSPDLKTILIKSLRDAIKAFPESFSSAGWRKELASQLSPDEKKLSDESKSLLNDALLLTESWIHKPATIEKLKKQEDLFGLKDLLIPEIFGTQAEIYAALGNEKQEKKSWKMAAEKTLKLNPNEQNPTLIIYLVHYLKGYETLTAIEPWLIKLETAYPEEHTYFQRHAQVLFDKKEPTKALALAQKAYNLSYGANRFRTGMLLAKIQKELSKKEKAQDTISELLQIPEAKLESNVKTVKKLEKFLASLKDTPSVAPLVK